MQRSRYHGTGVIRVEATFGRSSDAMAGENAVALTRPCGTLLDSVEPWDQSLHARDMRVRNVAKLSNTGLTLPYLEYIHS